MKMSIVALSLVLLAGCSSPPKEIADAWRNYRAVEYGMTRHEIHALIGREPNVRVKYYDWWLTQERTYPGYAAALSVMYDQDGRATNVSRGLDRLEHALRVAPD